MNRKNFIKTVTAGGVFSSLIPTVNSSPIIDDGLLDFQRSILKDIRRHNFCVFIMPRASSKSFLFDYILRKNLLFKNNKIRKFEFRRAFQKPFLFEGGQRCLVDELENSIELKEINDFLLRDPTQNKKLVALTSINDFSYDVFKATLENNPMNIYIKVFSYEDCGSLFEKDYIKYMKKHDPDYDSYLNLKKLVLNQ